MKEGAIALSKVRGYCYLIFLFDVLLLFHENIAKIFGTSDKKILYGFIVIILFQAVLCTLYVVKFVTTVSSKDKKRKEIIMYSARLRYNFIEMFVALGLLILNQSVVKSYYLDRIAIALLILILIFSLKNLTILQRRKF